MFFNNIYKPLFGFEILVSLQAGQNGILFGWASPNDILLQSDDTPLPTGKLSVEESSWVTSIMVNAHFSYFD